MAETVERPFSAPTQILRDQAIGGDIFDPGPIAVNVIGPNLAPGALDNVDDEIRVTLVVYSPGTEAIAPIVPNTAVVYVGTRRAQFPLSPGMAITLKKVSPKQVHVGSLSAGQVVYATAGGIYEKGD